MPHPLSRRSLLRSLGLGAVGGLTLACGRRAAGLDAATAPLAPTVAIPDDHDGDAGVAPQVCVATADNIEGPFFRAGAPHRTKLADAGTAPGTTMRIGGRVMGTDCRPVAGAILEVWHADATGAYDLHGWRLRGQLTTDRAGHWGLVSVRPERYLNGARYRPRHVHFKLHAAGHRSLTTQLYFSGDPYNVGDPWFEPSLVFAEAGPWPSRDYPEWWGRFDFVLEPA